MDTSTRLRTLSLRSARLSICLWLLRRRLRWLPRATVASAATVVNGYRGGYLWGRARRIWCRTWRRSPGWRRSQRPQVIDRRYMRVSRIFPGPAVTWLNGWLAPRPRVPSDYIAPSEGVADPAVKGIAFVLHVFVQAAMIAGCHRQVWSSSITSRRRLASAATATRLKPRVPFSRRPSTRLPQSVASGAAVPPMPIARPALRQSDKLPI